MTDLPDQALAKSIEEVAKFANKLIGPAFEETGLIIAEEIKYFRTRRRISLFQKTEKLLKERGIEPQQVGMKTLFHIVENGSLEDDENLHNKWAQLLATAADPSKSLVYSPAFIEILKQISPIEAEILDKLNIFVKKDGYYFDQNVSYFHLRYDLEDLIESLSLDRNQY